MADRFIPDEVFQSRGYKPFDPQSTSYADRAFQKRFRDGDTTLYFLNFYQYTYRDNSSPVPFRDSTTAEGYFYLPDREDQWVTVKIHLCNDLDYAEKFFADFYNKLGMVPDRHNQ